MKRKILTLAIAFSGFATYAQTFSPTYDISTAGSVNSLVGGYTFAYATTGSPWNGAFMSFGGFNNNYDCQISTDYGPNGGNHLSFRTHNGDAGIWNSWNEVWHSGNLNNNTTDFNARNFFANGSIGIGTTAPVDLLTLNVGAARKGITIVGDGDGSAYTDLTMSISTSSSVASGKPLGWDISHRKDGYFSGTTNGYSSLEFYAYLQGGGYYAPLSFKPDGNVVMVSNQNALGGNVLIGKTTQTNPGYKLDINGSVRANEMVVNTTGADFVFAPGYKMLSLSALKSYVELNHHLPEVPSAAEMSDQGLQLSKINTKLLQKVEELTLYLIEKDKQLGQFKSQLKQEHQHNSNQEARIVALEKKINKLSIKK